MAETITSTFHQQRRNLLKLVGSGLGVVHMATGSVSSVDDRRTHYCDAGVRYFLDPAEPKSGNFTRVEIDVPKSFDIHPDGIYLRDWTREEDREKLTDSSPVLFYDTLKTIPARMASNESSVLTTTLGPDNQPVSGVSLESKITLPDVEVRVAGSESMIKTMGKSATAAPSETTELELSPQEVNLKIESDTGGRTRPVTVIPVIEISNHGVLKVYE